MNDLMEKGISFEEEEALWCKEQEDWYEKSTEPLLIHKLIKKQPKCINPYSLSLIVKLTRVSKAKYTCFVINETTKSIGIRK
ncbi:MAG: hypothetical protein U9P72_02280 [Campylobacterota bacterium]|nr:hypothetical protein [Campylobacterota bacterium]